MAKIYEGDIGTEILIDMQRDMTSFTSITWKVLSPNRTQLTWTPTVYLDNFLRYTIQSGDLSEHGTYLIQPHMTLDDWTGSGTECKLVVHKKIY